MSHCESITPWVLPYYFQCSRRNDLLNPYTWLIITFVKTTSTNISETRLYTFPLRMHKWCNFVVSECVVSYLLHPPFQIETSLAIMAYTPIDRVFRRGNCIRSRNNRFPRNNNPFVIILQIWYVDVYCNNITKCLIDFWALLGM